MAPTTPRINHIMEMDKELLVVAANVLIRAENYTTLHSRIKQCIAEWETMPMLFTGKLAALNAVIDLGLNSQPAFDGFIKLVEDRRKVIPKQKKVDYQRVLMQQRRLRDRMAVDIESARLGKKLVGEAKEKFLGRMQRHWEKSRAEFIKAKGPLTWHQKIDVIQEFWKNLDAGLERQWRAAGYPKPKKS